MINSKGSAVVVGDERPQRNDEQMRVSHETIYQALYLPARGDLERRPARVLRSGRSRRRPQRRLDRRSARFVEPMTMISERPAEVAERLVAGHWEGDLVMGRKNRSAIATLVERKSLFLKLVHLPDGHSAEQVSTAVIAAMSDLPTHLRRSLTWDQGSEMGCHGDLRRSTGMGSTSATPRARGSADATRTRMDSCASISRRAPTLAFTALRTWPQSPQS